VRVLGIVAAAATIIGTVVGVLQWIDWHPGTAHRAGPRVSAAPDDRFLQVDQCIRNLGDAQNPLMKIADCGPGTMRILARIPQKVTTDADAAAAEACRKQAPGYTDYHFSTWTDDPGVSIVFCLRAES